MVKLTFPASPLYASMGGNCGFAQFGLNLTKSSMNLPNDDVNPTISK